MLYTAKCYWPGVDEAELRATVAKAAAPRESGEAFFQGALHLRGDDLVLWLYETPSRAAVKSASEEAGRPCERVIETVWVAPRTASPARAHTEDGRPRAAHAPGTGHRRLARLPVPDGNSPTFATWANVWVMRLDGPGARQITRGLPAGSPEWRTAT